MAALLVAGRSMTGELRPDQSGGKTLPTSSAVILHQENAASPHTTTTTREAQQVDKTGSHRVSSACHSSGQSAPTSNQYPSERQVLASAPPAGIHSYFRSTSDS